MENYYELNKILDVLHIVSYLVSFGTRPRMIRYDMIRYDTIRYDKIR